MENPKIKICRVANNDKFVKFNLLSQENNVCLKKVNKAFTSLRCSECGWTCKKNRNKQQFKCVNCNFKINSDLNASINISLNLENSFKKQQSSGFYISEIGKKLIVFLYYDELSFPPEDSFIPRGSPIQKVASPSKKFSRVQSLVIILGFLLLSITSETFLIIFTI